MKKVVYLMLTILLIIPCVFLFSACDTTAKITGFSVYIGENEYSSTNNTLTFTYGEDINLEEEFQVKVKYDNDTEKVIDKKTASEAGYELSGDILSLTSINAGTYSFTISYGEFESIQVNVVVNKRQLDVQNVTHDYTTPYEYTGASIGPSFSNLPSGVEIVTSGDAIRQTDAGTYTTNYSFVLMNGVSALNNEIINAPTQTQSITWTINKKEIDGTNITWDYNANDKLTYNGASQSVIYKNLPTGVTANYSNNSATNAGTYTATAEFVYDSDNYTLINLTNNIETLSWQIKKHKLNIPSFTGTYVYTGYEQSVTEVNFDSTLMTKTGTFSATKVQGYNAKYNLIDNDNYMWSDETNEEKTKTWSITPAQVTVVSKTLAPFNYEYTGSYYYIGFNYTDFTYANNCFGIECTTLNDQAKATLMSNMSVVVMTPYYYYKNGTINQNYAKTDRTDLKLMIPLKFNNISSNIEIVNADDNDIVNLTYAGTIIKSTPTITSLPTINSTLNYGDALSTIDIQDGVATAPVAPFVYSSTAPNTSLGGTWTWKNPTDTPTASGKQKVVFTSPSSDMNPVECEIDVIVIKNVTLTVVNGTIQNQTNPYSCESNTELTVVADIHDGQTFASWSNGTTTVSTDSTYTFTILDDTTLTAVYTSNYPKLTFVPNDEENPTIYFAMAKDTTISGSVTIPATYLGVQVRIPTNLETTTGSGAFQSCNELNEVIISEGVLDGDYNYGHIPQYAFANCAKLYSLTINGDCRSTETNTFYDTTSLRVIHIPATQNYFKFHKANNACIIYKHNVDNEHNGYPSLSIDGGYGELYYLGDPTQYLNTYENTLYNYNNQFEYIKLNNKITITRYLSGENVVIPATIDEVPVEKIGKNAFRSTDIVNVETNVPIISDYAFSRCSKLESVKFLDIETLGTRVLEYSDNNDEGTDFTLLLRAKKGTNIKIGEALLDNSSNCTAIYFEGTKAEFNETQVSSFNSVFTAKPKYYYSSSAPTELGKFWHYNNENNVEIWPDYVPTLKGPKERLGIENVSELSSITNDSFEMWYQSPVSLYVQGADFTLSQFDIFTSSICKDLPSWETGKAKVENDHDRQDGHGSYLPLETYYYSHSFMPQDSLISYYVSAYKLPTSDIIHLDNCTVITYDGVTVNKETFSPSVYNAYTTYQNTSAYQTILSFEEDGMSETSTITGWSAGGKDYVYFKSEMFVEIAGQQVLINSFEQIFNTTDEIVYLYCAMMDEDTMEMSYGKLQLTYADYYTYNSPYEQESANTEEICDSFNLFTDIFGAYTGWTKDDFDTNFSTVGKIKIQDKVYDIEGYYVEDDEFLYCTLNGEFAYILGGDSVAFLNFDSSEITLPVVTDRTDHDYITWSAEQYQELLLMMNGSSGDDEKATWFDENTLSSFYLDGLTQPNGTLAYCHSENNYSSATIENSTSEDFDLLASAIFNKGYNYYYDENGDLLLANDYKYSKIYFENKDENQLTNQLSFCTYHTDSQGNVDYSLSIQFDVKTNTINLSISPYSSGGGGGDEPQTLTSLFDGYNVPENFKGIWDFQGSTITLIKINNEVYIEGNGQKLYFHKTTENEYLRYVYEQNEWMTDNQNLSFNDTRSAIQVFKDIIKNETDCPGISSIENYQSFNNCRLYTNGYDGYSEENYLLADYDLLVCNVIMDIPVTTLTIFDMTISSFDGIDIPNVTASPVGD